MSEENKSQAFPPRVWLDREAFDFVDFAECAKHYDGDEHEDDTQYLSLAEHEQLRAEDAARYEARIGRDEVKRAEQRIELRKKLDTAEAEVARLREASKNFISAFDTLGNTVERKGNWVELNQLALGYCLKRKSELREALAPKEKAE